MGFSKGASLTRSPQGSSLGDPKRRPYLVKYFIDPVRNRPLEAEIADCKEAIRLFLTRRGVRKVNEYGWVLLSAVFGSKWQASRGKDQIGAYRAIPKPFAGPVKTRPDAKIVMDQVRIDFLNMLVQP